MQTTTVAGGSGARPAVQVVPGGIKPPPPPELVAPVPEPVPERWSRDKMSAFREMAPAALCLVATNGPVSVTIWDAAGRVVQRLGHNRGMWPAKIARTSKWADTVTQTYDKSPFPGLFLGTQWRLWARTDGDRDRVAEAVIGLIEQRSEEHGGVAEMVNGFRDLGADLDLEMFQGEAVAIAKRLGVQVWDDDDLSRFLDRVLAEAEAIRQAGQRQAGAKTVSWALNHAIGKALGCTGVHKPAVRR